MEITTPFADLLPPRSGEEMDALRADILAQGVLNPCLVTEDGRLLDGHGRRSIDANAPLKTVAGSASWTDDECRAYIFRLNAGRRNLSHDQRREMHAAMKQTALSLRQQDAKRFTQDVLASMFGVTRQTVGNWLSVSNANVCIANTLPDARVTIPKAEHASIVARHKSGNTQEQIAADYKVSRGRIAQIIAQADKPKKTTKPRKRREPTANCDGRYFCVYVNREDESGLNFSDLFLTEEEATSDAIHRTKTKEARLAFVVVIDDGASNYRLIEVYPEAARVVVDCYRQMVAIPVLKMPEGF